MIIVLFGSRKLPAAARSLGQSMRILKTEVQGLHDDDEPSASPAAPAQLQQAAAPAAPDAQAQIAAMQKQLNDLQQQATVSANGEAAAEAKQTH